MSEQNGLPYWVLVEFQAIEKDLADIHRRMRDVTAKAMENVAMSFSAIVWKAAREFQGTGKTFSSRDIASLLGLSDPFKRRQIPVALSRLLKKGDGLERVRGSRGRYRLA